MKNNMYVAIISILILLFMIITASFSFFSFSKNISANITSSVTLASGSLAFVSSTSDELNFSVATTQMTTLNVSTTAVGNSSANIMVSLQPADSSSISSCTYDIVWEWVSSSKYEQSDVTLPYSVTKNSVTTTYNYEFSEKVDNNSEIDLSSLSWSNHIATIYSGSISNSGQSNLGNLVTKTHKIEAKIYNIDYYQSNIVGNTFEAKVYVSNVSCDIN